MERPTNGIRRLCGVMDGVRDNEFAEATVRKAAVAEACDMLDAEAEVLLRAEADAARRFAREEGRAEGRREAEQELAPRLMPECMEWPMWDDGRPVTYDDAPGDVVGMYLALDGSGYALMTDLPYQLMSEPGERVKRPAPKVLDADGAPIEAGETVWNPRTGDRLEVVEVGELVFVSKDGGDPFPILNPGEHITHRATVLAADGKPLEVGQTVWMVDAGIKFEVHSIEGDTVWGSLGGDCTDDGLDPKSLTHQRPVLDADGVTIKVGDTVWMVDDPDGPYRVTEVTTKYATHVHGYSDEFGDLDMSPSQLTHRAPVLAADGRPLRVGETVWGTGREEHEYVVLGQPGLGGGAGRFKAVCHDVTDDVDCDCDPDLLTHERPDSWDRLGEDAKKGSCDYFGCDANGCHGCPAYDWNTARGGSGCGNAKARDLVRRARALAGEIHGLVENQEIRFFHVVQVHESTLATIEARIREACGEGD